MDNTDLPQTLKRLHFLKLDSKPITNSHLFKYSLNNHFNAVVARIDGNVVGERNPQNENDSHIEIVATKPYSNGNHPEGDALKTINNLFKLTIKKHQDTRRRASYDTDKSDDNAEILLKCELFSGKEQILGCINVLKDTRSATYSYHVLESNWKGNSFFHISRKQSNKENKCDIIITSAESSNADTAGTIARICLEENKISLSMTPELSPLTKLRLISIMILMEMVENRQNEGST